MRRFVFAIIVVLAAACASTAAPFTRTVLPNGLTVIVKPEPGVGIVAIEAFVRSGAAQEREFNAGIGNLITSTLLASTRNKRAETVAGVVDSVGGNFVTEWNPDFTEIKAITTESGFDDAMSLLGDILNNANFEQKWVDRSREDILSSLAIGSDDVFQTTYELLKQRLYSDNPYKRPSLGYPRTLRALTTDDLAKFYRQYYAPNNIVVSVAGDITSERAVERIKRAFAGTSAVVLPKQRPIPEETIAASSSEVIERPISAAYFMFGFLAPGMESPEYAAMQVAATALGSGKGSRMFQSLREQKGLAYEVGAMYPKLKNQSHVVAYLVTDPYRRLGKGYSMQMLLSEVKKSTLEEINRMQNELLSPEEIERAKRYSIGTDSLRRQRLRDRAYNLGWLETIGLGCDYDTAFATKLDAVTAADVRKVSCKYFNNYALVIVLPEGTGG